MLQIKIGNLADPRVIALMEVHLTRSRAETAPGSAHALDIKELARPEISFWTIWDGENLMGMGALRALGIDEGEIKSMRTVEAARRSGVGSAMLSHIIARARELGMTRLCLETGAWPYFDPARSFYKKHGFIECTPFAEYKLDPNSVFMKRAI